MPLINTKGFNKKQRIATKGFDNLIATSLVLIKGFFKNKLLTQGFGKKSSIRKTRALITNVSANFSLSDIKVLTYEIPSQSQLIPRTKTYQESTNFGGSDSTATIAALLYKKHTRKANVKINGIFLHSNVNKLIVKIVEDDEALSLILANIIPEKSKKILEVTREDNEINAVLNILANLEKEKSYFKEDDIEIIEILNSLDEIITNKTDEEIFDLLLTLNEIINDKKEEMKLKENIIIEEEEILSIISELL
jgi:hypothetical protein